MNKEQVQGRIEEATGKAKEVVGRILSDAALELEGNIAKNAGKIRADLGDLNEKLNDEINGDR